MSTALVADGSVIVQAFVPDEVSGNAHHVLSRGLELHAPDHLPSEFGNALWKKVRRGSLTNAQATELAGLFMQASLRLHPTAPLLPDALDIAVRFERTVYDALYVALARQLGAQLVTADRRLYNALRDAFPETMLWVEDLTDSEAADSATRAT